MKLRWLCVPFLLCGLCATPAAADSRVIVRTTLGLQGLQQVCAGVPFVQLCTVDSGLGDPSAQLFLVTTPLDLNLFVNIIAYVPGIVAAEPDQTVSLINGQTLTNLPLPLITPVASDGSIVWDGYANQPAAQIVHVSQAQNSFGVTGAGIIADIDTGVDPNHPALKSVLLQGYDFTRNQPGGSEMTDFTGTPPEDNSDNTGQLDQSTAAVLDQSTAAVLDGTSLYPTFGHGTMVMGIIHLVAPTAQLLPLKAFNSNGTGYLSDILRAVYFGVRSGANVINMSFDFTSSSTELSKALNYARQNNVICVASAGNDGAQEVVYPAAIQKDVMGVASTSDMDMRSSFSNYGSAAVWIAAPGENIVSTYPFGTFAQGSGTSFSAPFVSGAGSLLLNLNAAINQAGAAAAIANAVPVGPGMGNGRLDLVQALQSVPLGNGSDPR